MTFQAGIPNASDLISVSQSDIKNNFTSLSNTFDVNHVDFNASGAGKHKYVEFPNQSSNPVTSSGEVALFAKDLSGVSTLYMRKASNGTVIQMSGVDPSAATPGYTFLPGGMILQWANTSGSNGSSITFPLAFPNTCFSVVVTYNGASTVANNVVCINGFSTTGFTLRTNAAAGINFTYFAVGN